MATLFTNTQSIPLAEKMRPNTLAEFVGQKKIMGSDRALRQLIEKREIPSMIFWGPPGSGKTTLARLIAKETKKEFIQYSAVEAGTKEIKQFLEQARKKQLAGFNQSIIRQYLS